MPSKKSGGKRAVEKKHRARAAARKRDLGGAVYRTLVGKVDLGDEAYRTLVGEVPFQDFEGAYGWLTRALLFACDTAMTDPGLAVEARREQLARLAPQLVKALEPARLAEELRAFKRALDELKGGHASKDASGTPGGAAGKAPLH